MSHIRQTGKPKQVAYASGPRVLRPGDVIDLTKVEDSPLAPWSLLYWRHVGEKFGFTKVRVVSVIHDSVELEVVE